jgi:hypothetical protein
VFVGNSDRSAVWPSDPGADLLAWRSLMCREVKRPQRPMERAGEGCLIPVSEVFEFSLAVLIMKLRT